MKYWHNPINVRKKARPSWNSVKMAYEYINGLSKNEIDNIKKAESKYKWIGGEVYVPFLSSPKTYENTCALQVSYALIMVECQL